MTGILTKRLLSRVVRRVELASDAVLYRIPSRRRALESALFQRYMEMGVPKAVVFDFDHLQATTLKYVESMALHPGGIEFRYASKCEKPTLYSSIYACLSYSLYGKLLGQPEARLQNWLDYFDRHQSAEDGLFRDPVVAGKQFDECEWWGAKHLAGHIIMAYAALGKRPKHPFRLLRCYYEKDYLRRWLIQLRDSKEFIDASNEIMNVGTLLQYQRDQFEDDGAANAVQAMLQWLTEEMDPDTGLWWKGPHSTPREISHAVQGAYHIQPLFQYDNLTLPHAEKMLQFVLRTQNALGGFGIELNSTGCEDIDSIYPLVTYGGRSLRPQDVRRALSRSLPWVLANQNPDGGFAWVLQRAFQYGHEQMATGVDESSLFGTWFRTLSLAFLVPALSLPNQYRRTKCPGYES